MTGNDMINKDIKPLLASPLATVPTKLSDIEKRTLTRHDKLHLMDCFRETGPILKAPIFSLIETKITTIPIIDVTATLYPLSNNEQSRC